MAVRLEKHADSVPGLLLDNPSARNAMTLQDWYDAREILAQTMADPAVRSLVLRGAGGAFCAGANLSFLDELRAMEPPERRAAIGVGGELIRDLVRFPAPTTALVSGSAFGIGVCLALACDRLIATPDAVFGFIFTGIGLPAGDMGAPWLLSRRLGTRRAWGLLSRAAVVDAQTALDLGLVDELIDPAEIDELPARLSAEGASAAPSAVVPTKRQILELEGAYDELDGQLEQQLTELVAAVGGSDFTEGLAARRERRPAQFADRRIDPGM